MNVDSFGPDTGHGTSELRLISLTFDLRATSKRCLVGNLAFKSYIIG